MTENQRLIFYNILYLQCLKLFDAFYNLGHVPTPEIVDLVRTIGERAEIPKEQLANLEIVEFHGATIH